MEEVYDLSNVRYVDWNPSKYVNGFLFSPDRKKVALVVKQKPAWQAGKMNGIGGKVEDKETYDEAVIREFFEETGVVVNGWRKFCVLTGEKFILVNFVAFSEGIEFVKTMEKEEIVVKDVETLDYNLTIPNLRWLVPMALDKDSLHAEVIENCTQETI